MQATTLVFLFLGFFGKSFADEGDVKKEDQYWYTRETDNVTEIIKRIFTGYDKNIRPYHKVKPLQIAISLGVLSISYISEENMEFLMDVYYRQYWRDPRLAYGNGNTSIILRGDILNKMWLPDTYIDNAKTSVVDKDVKTVSLSANGSIFYDFKAMYQCTSKMNLRNYPMDEQILKIQIYSYAYDSDKILLKWTGGRVLLNKELAAFIIEDVILLEEKHKFSIGIFSSLTSQFKIRRRLGYFVMQFYFPCILCAVVSWLPFWMDRYQIGDRMSLGITTLLTEMFLSQYINSAMPQVSYVKAADEFLLASFIFILMALIESVVVYNVRVDVREKKKRRKASRKDKEQKKLPVVEDFALSITDVCLEENKMREAQPEKARNHSDQHSDQPKKLQTKTRDLGSGVDKLSRILFPSSYVAFVACYFGRYLLFN